MIIIFVIVKLQVGISNETFPFHWFMALKFSKLRHQVFKLQTSQPNGEES